MTPVVITLPMLSSPFLVILFGFTAAFVALRVGMRLWDLIGV